MIGFQYEGQNYKVGQRAYYLNRIVLPDGRMLEVEKWSGTSPLHPEVLKEVDLTFSGFVLVDFRAEPKDVAAIFNAELATKMVA
jgi:hypothetical protein